MEDTRRAFLQKLASAIGSLVVNPPVESLNGENPDRYEEFILPFTQTEESASKMVRKPSPMSTRGHRHEIIETEEEKVLGFARLRYDNQNDSLEWLAPFGPDGAEGPLWISMDHPHYQSEDRFDEKSFYHHFGIVGSKAAPLRRLEDETAEAIWSQVNAQDNVPTSASEIFENPSAMRELNQWFNESISSEINQERIIEEVEETYGGKDSITQEESPETIQFDDPEYTEFMGWKENLLLRKGAPERNYSQLGEKELIEIGRDNKIKDSLKRDLHRETFNDELRISDELELELDEQVDLNVLETKDNYVETDFYSGENITINISEEGVANITYHEEPGDLVNEEEKIETMMNQYVNGKRTPESSDEEALATLAYAAINK